MTLFELACAAATVAILCRGAVTRPRRARCPLGWYVEGIRPSGSFDCRRRPGGDPLYDGAGGYPDRAVDRPGAIGGRIYCAGDRPIVVDARTVGCVAGLDYRRGMITVMRGEL